MVVDIRFIGFFHFLRGTHDFHTEGCVVASQNLDQQKPKSTRRKPRSTKIITHKNKDMPTITKTKFWNPDPKLNPVFFNNYIETKLKDIQQLHKNKTQTQIILGLLRNQTQNSNPKSINKTQDLKPQITTDLERERELGFWPWV